MLVFVGLFIRLRITESPLFAIAGAELEGKPVVSALDGDHRPPRPTVLPAGRVERGG